MSGAVQPIVIVSTGRTGTGFLADLLQRRVPQAEAHHITPRSTWVNVLSNMHLSGLVPRRVLVAFVQMLKGRELERCTRPFFVDSNNHLYALVAIAPQLYPNLRVVHLVRDPRSYVRSHLNWARQRPKSFVANYLLPFWQPHPFLLGEMPLGRAIALSRFERFCWIWDFKNRLIASAATPGTPYLRLRFEDLFENSEPEPHFRRLLDFMGLPEIPGVGVEARRPHNETRRRRYPPWREWTPAQCARLHALCATRMAEYGYGAEEEWLEKVRTGDGELHKETMPSSGG